MCGLDTEVDGGRTSEAEETESTKGQSWKCDSGVLGIAIRQRAAVEKRSEELQGMSLDRLLGVWVMTDHVGPCGSMKNAYYKLLRLKKISLSSTFPPSFSA